jgi:hypothetical protein
VRAVALLVLALLATLPLLPLALALLLLLVLALVLPLAATLLPSLTLLALLLAGAATPAPATARPVATGVAGCLAGLLPAGLLLVGRLALLDLLFGLVRLLLRASPPPATAPAASLACVVTLRRWSLLVLFAQ